MLQEVEKASDLLQTNDPWLKYATAESYIVMEEKELLGMGEKYKFVSQTEGVILDFGPHIIPRKVIRIALTQLLEVN